MVPCCSGDVRLLLPVWAHHRHSNLRRPPRHRPARRRLRRELHHLRIPLCLDCMSQFLAFTLFFTHITHCNCIAHTQTMCVVCAMNLYVCAIYAMLQWICLIYSYLESYLSILDIKFNLWNSNIFVYWIGNWKLQLKLHTLDSINWTEPS